MSENEGYQRFTITPNPHALILLRDTDTDRERLIGILFDEWHETTMSMAEKRADAILAALRGSDEPG